MTATQGTPSLQQTLTSPQQHPPHPVPQQQLMLPQQQPQGQFTPQRIQQLSPSARRNLVQALNFSPPEELPGTSRTVRPQSGQGLFNPDQLQRLRALEMEAPTLYGAPTMHEQVGSTSTASSAVQAEVQRQLQEFMNQHRNETVDLRQQVEQLRRERNELRAMHSHLPEGDSVPRGDRAMHSHLPEGDSVPGGDRAMHSHLPEGDSIPRGDRAMHSHLPGGDSLPRGDRATHSHLPGGDQRVHSQQVPGGDQRMHSQLPGGDQQMHSQLPGGDQRMHSQLPGGDQRMHSQLPGGDQMHSQLPGGDQRTHSQLHGGDQMHSQLPGGDQRMHSQLPGGDQQMHSQLPGGDQRTHSQLPGGDQQMHSQLPGGDQRTHSQLPGGDQGEDESGEKEADRSQSPDPQGKTQPTPMELLGVIATGMRQLQEVQIKQMDKRDGPEVVKPGISSLPQLDAPGKDTSPVDIQDWLEEVGSIMGDLSDTSHEWWTGVREVADEHYKKWVTATPMEKLTLALPRNPKLEHGKYGRVNARAAGMILGALPAEVKSEMVTKKVTGSSLSLGVQAPYDLQAGRRAGENAVAGAVDNSRGCVHTGAGGAGAQEVGQMVFTCQGPDGGGPRPSSHGEGLGFDRRSGPGEEPRCLAQNHNDEEQTAAGQ